jgi:hypothetical protein
VALYGADHGASAATSTITVTNSPSVVNSGVFKLVLQADECGTDTGMLRITHASCAPQYIPLDMVDYDDSDIYSAVIAVSATVDTSAIAAKVWSDYESKVGASPSQVYSQLQSQIGAVTASVSASDISDIASRVWSEKYSTHSLASSFGSAFSALWTDADNAASRALVVQSMVSDVDSQLLVTHSLLSDVDSQVNLLATSNYLSTVHEDLSSKIDANDTSAVATRVWSDYGSQVGATPSQVYSQLQSQIGAVTASLSASDISDIASRVWSEKYSTHSLASSFGSAFSALWTDADNASSRALVVQSMVSDVDSALVVMDTANDSQYSDLASKIGNVSVTLTASDISDIASATAAAIGFTDSGIASKVWSNYGSQVGTTPSNVYSNLQSQIGGITAGVSASDISDIASAVWAEKWHVHSTASSFGSAFEVLMSSVSDLTSRVTKEAASKSLLSDVESNVRSQIAGLSAAISDVDSALTSQYSNMTSRIPKEVASKSLLSDVDSQVRSQIAGLSATVSDVYSAVSNLQSDFSSRVPKEVASKSLLSDVESNVRSQLSDISSKVTEVDSQLTITASQVVLVNSGVDQIQADLPGTITKNTALANFEFLMIDSTDDVSPKTGLSITAQRSIDGAAFGSCANAATELSNGIYVIDLAASDLNGDVVTLRFTAAGANDRVITIVTQPT